MGLEKFAVLWKVFESTGLSQRVFCSEIGLSFSTFQYWNRKRRHSQLEPVSTGFVELVSDKPSPHSICIECGPFRLRIEGTSLPENFGLLLRSMREAL